MNIPEEVIEAAAKAAYIADNLGWDGAEAAWDDMGGSERSFERAGWEIAARAALEAAWAVMLPEITDDEIARDLDSRIPNGSPLWLERQVADRRAIADTVRHFTRGGHSSTE